MVACVPPAGNCNADHAPVTFDGQVVTVNRIFLPLGQSLTITYSDATVPAAPGPATFSTAENPTADAPLNSVIPSPVVTVTCADGTGTETVSPGTVTAASTGTLAFTFAPASGCELVGGAVSLTVPPGWTLPSATPGAAGYVTTSPGAPVPAVSGSAIAVTGITLAAGQAFTITYSNATAPGSTTTSTFATSEQTASTGAPAPLLSPPQVTVGRPAQAHRRPPRARAHRRPPAPAHRRPPPAGRSRYSPLAWGRPRVRLREP